MTEKRCLAQVLLTLVFMVLRELFRYRVAGKGSPKPLTSISGFIILGPACWQ